MFSFFSKIFILSTALYLFASINVGIIHAQVKGLQETVGIGEAQKKLIDVPVFKQKTEGSSLRAGLLLYIARIVAAVLGVTGIIALLIVVYAGFLYLTAAGSDETIRKAKRMLFAGVLGLIVIFGAYTLSRFVIGKLAG